MSIFFHCRLIEILHFLFVQIVCHFYAGLQVCVGIRCSSSIMQAECNLSNCRKLEKNIC